MLKTDFCWKNCQKHKGSTRHDKAMLLLQTNLHFFGIVQFTRKIYSLTDIQRYFCGDYGRFDSVTDRSKVARQER